MPLEKQTVEIVLEGLEQKTDHKTVVPGRLARAVNVEYDKGGAMNKRRGYLRVPVSDNVVTTPIAILQSDVFHKLAVYQDELLIFSHDQLYALISRTSAVDGTGFAIRGPVSRGTVRRQIVHVSSVSQEVP